MTLSAMHGRHEEIGVERLSLGVVNEGYYEAVRSR